LFVRSVVVSLFVALPAFADAPSIAVLDVRAPAGTDPAVVSSLSSLLPVEASRRQLKVTSGNDLRAMLDLERQRQLTGCTESQCLAEFASAMGSEWVLLSEVSELGGQWLLTLSLVQTSQREATTRAARKTSNKGALVELAASAADEVLSRFPLVTQASTPSAANPVRTVGFVVGGVGLAAVAGGAVSGVLALQAFNDARAEGLAGRSDTFETNRTTATDRMVIANILYVAGGITLAAGVLMAVFGSPPKSITIAPVLSPDGLAVVFHLVL
jgi:hypothetical protein